MTAPAPAPILLAADELDLLESTVDAGLAAAIDALATLRARQAHRARGFESWGEYLLARFGEALRRLRLDREDHLAVVDYVARPAEGRKPMPTRRIAELLAVSNGTAQQYRREIGLAPAPAPKPDPLPVPTGKKYRQAAVWLQRAADGQLAGYPTGLTLVELAKVTGWTEGSASGQLSYLLNPSRGLALAERLDDVVRAGQRVHRLTDAGRALLGAR